MSNNDQLTKLRAERDTAFKQRDNATALRINEQIYKLKSSDSAPKTQSPPQPHHPPQPNAQPKPQPPQTAALKSDLKSTL